MMVPPLTGVNMASSTYIMTCHLSKTLSSIFFPDRRHSMGYSGGGRGSKRDYGGRGGSYYDRRYSDLLNAISNMNTFCILLFRSSDDPHVYTSYNSYDGS